MGIDCACSIELDYDYEGAPPGKYYDEVAYSYTHTFTEVRPCSECVQALINPGDVGVYSKYLVRSSEDDSILDTYEYGCCPHCSSIIKTYFCDMPSGNMFDVLQEELAEQEYWALTHNGEGSVADGRLNKLTPLAREWVIEIIEDIWDDQDIPEDEKVCF